MRQGGPNNGRRPRGRHHGGGGNGGNSGGGGNNHQPSGPMRDNRPRSASSLRHQTFDSNGPDVRVRGNAWQVFEKYQALARDATSAGDRVAAETYLQHAEHYYRIIEAINEATAVEQRQQGGAPRPPQAFGQQPEIPTNYYGTDGNVVPPGAPQQQIQPGSAQPQQQTMPQQAEVQMLNQPQPSAFFAPEETDEQGNAPEPKVVNR